MPQPPREAFAVLGDVVRSRAHPDQPELFKTVRVALEWVSRQVDTNAVLQPLAMTIGDEFQGAFVELSVALRAVLLTQLRLSGAASLRFGVGHGQIETSPDVEVPHGQSGTAWWAARNAVDSVKQREHEKDAYRSCAFEGSDVRLGRPVEAFLVLRDRILHDMDERDRLIALGIAVGRPQKEIAEELGIDPAAVSRRKFTNRIDALVAAHTTLGSA